MQHTQGKIFPQNLNPVVYDARMVVEHVSISTDSIADTKLVNFQGVESNYMYSETKTMRSMHYYRFTYFPWTVCCFVRPILSMNNLIAVCPTHFVPHFVPHLVPHPVPNEGGWLISSRVR